MWACRSCRPVQYSLLQHLAREPLGISKHGIDVVFALVLGHHLGLSGVHCLDMVVAPDCPCNLKLLGRKAKPLWFRPLCFSENDGSVLLHLAPTPDGAGLTEGRTQDTCGSESWQIHRAVVCLPEPPVPDAGLRDSHKLSVWKRSVSPKTDRPPWQRWRLGPCTPGGCGAGR